MILSVKKREDPVPLLWLDEGVIQNFSDRIHYRHPTQDLWLPLLSPTTK